MLAALIFLLQETPQEYLKCKSEELVVNVYTGNEEEVAEILANMNSTQRSYWKG